MLRFLVALSTLVFFARGASFPDTYVVSRSPTSGDYGVQRVSFGGREEAATLTTVLDDPAKTKYIAQVNAWNCNAISADGKYWHMVTTEKDVLAVLSVELGATNSTRVRTLSPSMAQTDVHPSGCVWYAGRDELVMNSWSSAEDGSIEYFFDGINVTSGATRRITSWKSGIRGVHFKVSAIDERGNLLMANTQLGAKYLLVIDASSTGKKFADALTANVTLSTDGIVTDTIDGEALFITFPFDNTHEAAFGSASTSALRGGSKKEVTLSEPGNWTISNPGLAVAVDDTTIMYQTGSGSWGPDSDATFHFCTVAYPLVDAPRCHNSTTIETMVWTYATVPLAPLAPRGRHPRLLRIILSAAAGACVLGGLLYACYVKRRDQSRVGYTVV
jgi:hypothetical protein